MAADLGNVMVYALDPGETTGWCAMGVPPEVLHGAKSPGDTLDHNVRWEGILDYGEVDCRYENEGVQTLLDHALIDYPTAAIVIEDFIVDFARINKHRSTLSPVRVTAKFEFGLWDYEASQTQRIILQSASLAKTTCTDARLKEWDFYDRNSGDHARDAVRHAYYFLRGCRGQALQAREKRWRSWPHLFDDPQVRTKTTRQKPLGERVPGL